MRQTASLPPEEDPAGKLAAFAVDTRFEDIPDHVIELARKAILDTLAVTIAGSSWEVSPAIVAQVAEWGGAPQSPVLIYGHKVPAPAAAFANGVMARGIDMGDVHETGGHVSEWNLPAMFAALNIAGRRISGREFLCAYVASAEMSVRISAACNLVGRQTTIGMPGEFNGTLCAAASVCRLLGYTAAETWNTLGICYSVHGFSEMQKYAEGTQMARVQHCFAGETALKAALLTRRGVTGPKGIFHGGLGGVFKHISWEDTSPELLTEELGTRWHYAEGLSMKPFSACKFTHSFITGVLELRRLHGFAAGDVEAINCIGSEQALMTVEPRDAKWNPRSVPEAMFSAPYAIATAVLTGDFFLYDLAPAQIMRADKHALMARIAIVADPAIIDAFEGYRVEVVLKDGRSFWQTSPYVKGHTRNPMSWDDLTEKLAKCARFSAVPFSEARLRELVRACQRLDRMEDACSLMELMVPGAAHASLAA